MPVEHEDEQEGEEYAVPAYLLEGVMVEEDVSVDLRVAQNDVQGLQVALVLKEPICLLLAIGLYQGQW